LGLPRYAPREAIERTRADFADAAPCAPLMERELEAPLNTLRQMFLL
jgi:hypothetical protein